MPLCLIEVIFECVPQLIRGSCFLHFGKGLSDLLFGVIDILQLVEEEFFQVLTTVRLEASWRGESRRGGGHASLHSTGGGPHHGRATAVLSSG